MAVYNQYKEYKGVVVVAPDGEMTWFKSNLQYDLEDAKDYLYDLRDEEK
jgi:hypothetical protein